MHLLAVHRILLGESGVRCCCAATGLGPPASTPRLAGLATRPADADSGVMAAAIAASTFSIPLLPSGEGRPLLEDARNAATPPLGLPPRPGECALTAQSMSWQ